MNSKIKQVYIMAVAMVLAITVVGILAPPSESGPLSESARALVGHWRTTTIVFESPEDEHLVLNPDGTWEDWVVTASHSSATTTGTWRVEGKALIMQADGNGQKLSRPFTIYEGQLVFPNIENKRLFWERIER